MLWAALVFAVGIATGVHAWRPPLWWVVAWMSLHCRARIGSGGGVERRSSSR
jgi:hypothetical protein